MKVIDIKLSTFGNGKILKAIKSKQSGYRSRLFDLLTMFVYLFPFSSRIVRPMSGPPLCATRHKIPGRAITRLDKHFLTRATFSKTCRINQIGGASQFSRLAKFMYRSALSYGDVARYLHINTSII